MRWTIALVVMLSAVSASGQKTLSDGVKELSTQLSASITKEQKKRVAVLPFKELDGQTTVLGTFIAEELLSHLVNSGLKIVERGLLDKLLAEQKLQQTGAIDPTTAKRVGEVAGVDVIITGSVTDLQSNVGVNCRIIDTSTGEVFAAAQVKITKDDDVRKIMATLLPGNSPVAPGASRVSASGTAPSWQESDARFVVDAFTKKGTVIVATFGVENTSTKTLHIDKTFALLDENGESWSGGTEDGYWNIQAAIPAGGRKRIRYRFTAKGASDGKVYTITTGQGDHLISGVRPTS